MSNQKNKKDSLPQSFEELSDVEFIAYADYLSSPYYKAYMDAKNQSEIIDKKDIYEGSFKPSKGFEDVGGGTLGYRRRKGFLALIVIFMIAVIAVAALGYIGEIVPEYVSAFNKVEGEEVAYLGITDPVLGALNKFAGMDMESVFYNDALQDLDSSNIAEMIAFYGLPIVVALSLLFALIILITALAALCKKGIAKGFVQKKTKFGFLSLLLFLLSLFTAACAIVWNGQGFSSIMDFFTFSTANIYAGYGLLGLIGLSLLSLICNLCAYKKIR